MSYLSLTDSDREAMLAEIGIDSIEELFRDIPAGVRLDRELDLEPPLTEAELQRHLEGLAARNVDTTRELSFLGAGIYDHYVPAVADAVVQRGEFLTAYTPYQPEMSQGVLQAIFEYQTVVCELTGMDVSNASGYDGTTVAADACFIAKHVTGRSRIVVTEATNPQVRQVVKTYAPGFGLDVVEVPHRSGATDPDELGAAAQDAAAVIFQQPNFFGVLEPAPDLASAANDAGALAVAHVDPMSLGVLEAPGNYGCAIAIGEGQGTGNYPSFGGPHYGFLAARNDFIRRMPGRIVGETTDADGDRAYVLTLQTREQHIRRQKATSNITTNQTLLALQGLVALSWLGPAGPARGGGDVPEPRRVCERSARPRAGVPGAHHLQGVRRARGRKRARRDPRVSRPRRSPRVRARARLPGARRRPSRLRDRETDAGRHRPACRGAPRGRRVKLIFEKSQPGRRGGEPPRRDGLPAVEVPEELRRAEPPRLPGAFRARDPAALHRAVDAQLRDRHRLLPARLLHDEVQPADQRAARRPRRLRAPASAPGRGRRRRAHSS